MSTEWEKYEPQRAIQDTHRMDKEEEEKKKARVEGKLDLSDDESGDECVDTD